ncbi:MAG TPA: CdaR family protein [Paenibacillus sp.]|uniref:CdaR family protein n=1 Tax=Paenibacillus sp. TaxID=58172 RepID=UPI0028D1DACA|nr:CdaR family protein [Paenibacillus sp.]HUC92786.1 CdaR family protein [Paenibacillus sp.]
MDKWLNHPTSLKIISLTIGLLLWAVVRYDPESTPNQVASSVDTQEFAAVKIATEGLDEATQSLRSIEPSVVRLVVEGSRSDLRLASNDDYKVWVDITGLAEGEHELNVRYEMPPRVRVRQISPARVKVSIVAVQTKEFEALILTSGTPANGYKVGEPVVKPNNRVFVTLAKDLLDRVETVSALLDVEGIDENVVEKKLRLAAYDAQGNEIKEARLRPNVVEVEVPITKPFKKVPLQLGFAGKLQEGLSIASLTPATESVTVYGPQAALDRLEFYEGAVVNLAAIKQSGTFTLDLKPTGELAAVEPQKLEVGIVVEASETRTLPRIPVTIRGLQEGLTATMALPAGGVTDLIVVGAPSVLAKLTNKDVQAIADLNGLAPGRHTVPLNVLLPQFVLPGFDSPPSVVIDITDDPENADAASAPDDGGNTIDEPAAAGEAGAGAESKTGTGRDSGTGTGADTDTGTGKGSGDAVYTDAAAGVPDAG